MYAFISHSHKDLQIAIEINNLLAQGKVNSFLAHKDIQVSEEWREKILSEIFQSNIFICILTKNYQESPWCVQESGIAAFKKDMRIIPVSIDGTLSPGFIRKFQAVHIEPDHKIDWGNLIKAFGSLDAIDIIINMLENNTDFNQAGKTTGMLSHYATDLNNDQAKRILKLFADNPSVCNSWFVAELLKQMLDQYSHLASEKTLEKIKEGEAFRVLNSQ